VFTAGVHTRVLRRHYAMILCSRPDCGVSTPCRLLPLLDVFLPYEACGIASVGAPTAVATAEEVRLMVVVSESSIH